MPAPQSITSGRCGRVTALLTKKGNLQVRAFTVDGDKPPRVFIFQAWPPRAWEMTPKGPRGRNFAGTLNIDVIQTLAKSWKSKAKKEDLENIRIWRAGYKDGPLTRFHINFGKKIPIEEIRNFAFSGRKTLDRWEKIPLFVLEGKNQYQEWLNQIPKEARKAALSTSIPKRDRSEILWISYKCPEFLDLLKSAPALAILVLQEAKQELRLNSSSPTSVGKAIDKHYVEKRIKAVCKMKRKQILQSSGIYSKALKITQNLPPRDISLSLLSSIPQEVWSWKVITHCPKNYLSARLLLVIRSILSRTIPDFRRGDLTENGITETTALQNINMKVLWAISREGRFITGKGDIRRDKYSEILIDSLRMLRQLQKNDIPIQIQELTRLEDLQAFHDHIMDVYLEWQEPLVAQRKREEKLALMKPFDVPPPLPGFGPITPLHTPLMIQEEGQRMHHCVGSYIDYVKERTSYIYSIQTEDERATIELRRNHEETHWFINQIRGYCNNKPSQELLDMVTFWTEKFGVDGTSKQGL